MIEPKTERVLDELRTSPAWREAERRVLAEESEARRKLLSELHQLEKNYGANLPKLVAGVAAATVKVESARAALATAEAELERCCGAESSERTAYDTRRGRLSGALTTPFLERLATFSAAIDRASKAIADRMWSAVAPPSLATSYHRAALNNQDEVRRALDSLVALRSRALALPCEIADPSELEAAFLRLEAEALEIVERVPSKPPVDWLERAAAQIRQRVFGVSEGEVAR